MLGSQGKSVQETNDSPFIPESISTHDLAVSNFSHVIFPDIPDFFSPETNINVPYILTEAIEPSSRDWIGLFRVGWGSPRDYSTYVWAPKPQNSSLSKARPQSVSFQAYQLPGDDGEFYQFCYVTKQGYVRGASTPFQFRQSNENDCYVEMEDESGMIILRTKSDALEEQLASISQEKESLESSIETLKKEKTELTEKIASLEMDLTKSQETLNNSEEKSLILKGDLEKLKKNLEDSQNRIQQAETEIQANKTSLDAAEKTIDNLKKQIEQLEEEKQNVVDAKATDDEKYVKTINEKEVKILEFEREKVTLLDRIKTLSLVKEEAQKQSVSQQVAHDQATKASAKAKEEISVKLQCCKDERDLFKVQLSESEVQRQEALQQLQILTQKLQEVEKKMNAKDEELKQKSEELKNVQDSSDELKKKFKHELNKHQEHLRNALERANGEKTAKQLLSKELSDATATRDKLMDDLNKAKKGKEELCESLQGKERMVGSLQVRLEQVEEELAKSESMLLEHEKNVRAEKRRSREVEQEMKEKVTLLQQQLEEADHAVATAASKAGLTTEMKLQSAPAAKGSSDGESKADESKAVIDDLKAQVTDLTTRLNMGADAYKDKFMECHKMEKKLKKMKQLLQAKKTAAASSATPRGKASKESEAATKAGSPQSWVEKFEKIVSAALADPDAEEQEQAKQLQLKIETLQKTVTLEQGKHNKYKQLYNDEKQKAKALKEKEETASKVLNDVKSKAKSLLEENKMLKAQLKEFVEQSDDVNLKQMMTYPPESSSSDVSSSQDTEDGRDEDEHFKDAPGVPMYSPAHYRVKKGTSEQSTSSDASDEASYTGGNGSFGKFNMCAEKDDEASGVDTFSYKVRQKVVSRQPIGSPPHIPDVITYKPGQPGASRGVPVVTSSNYEARKRKMQQKRKSKKK